MIFVRTYF